MHLLATIPMLAVFALQTAIPSGDLQSKPAREKVASVTYLFPEQVTIPAGKPSPVDLHFKVADGLHVNSHTPHAEELIPTTLAVPDNADVRLASATFPPGKDFSFAINPKEKLNVYTGEFTVHATLVSSKGEHLVQGTLHYQACNNAACFPPRSIPVVLDVIAK
jgi:hypothetical protein